MKRAWSVNRVLIIAFAVSSGLFKVGGGQADVELFGKLGMTVGMVTFFGVVQTVAGVLCVMERARSWAAVMLALCNAFASLALFVAGVQPFAVISLLFVAMAAWVARRP